MNEPLRTELERLFSAKLSDAALEDQLNALANAQPEAFRSLSDIWAIRLYERSPYIFGDFIAAHLTGDQQDVVESLLRRAIHRKLNRTGGRGRSGRSHGDGEGYRRSRRH